MQNPADRFRRDARAAGPRDRARVDGRAGGVLTSSTSSKFRSPVFLKCARFASLIFRSFSETASRQNSSHEFATLSSMPFSLLLFLDLLWRLFSSSRKEGDMFFIYFLYQQEISKQEKKKILALLFSSLERVFFSSFLPRGRAAKKAISLTVPQNTRIHIKKIC